MIEVRVTEAEVMAVGEQFQHMPFEYWLGIALAKKGIKFKPTFSPLGLEHLREPYWIRRDNMTQELIVRQWAEHEED